MTGEEILSFIQPEILILIPVLIILGLMLKKAEYIKDWTIPIILGVIGILFAILILGFENGFIGQVILNGILQGILAAGMAVYVHQLTIQSTRKRVEDQD
ncbi:phage holin family protein [Tissierellaceae bacterium HCP3S3_D8]